MPGDARAREERGNGLSPHAVELSVPKGGLQLIDAAVASRDAVAQHEAACGLRGKLGGMGDEDGGSVAEQPMGRREERLKDVTPRRPIEGGEDVIEQCDGGGSVDGACEGHSLLLPPAELPREGSNAAARSAAAVDA